MQKVNLVTLLTIAQFQRHVTHIHAGGYEQIATRHTESWPEMGDDEMDALVVNRGEDFVDGHDPLEFDSVDLVKFGAVAGLMLFHIEDNRPMVELEKVTKIINSETVTDLIAKIRSLCGNTIEMDYVDHYINSHVKESDDLKEIIDQACKLNALYVTIKSQILNKPPILDTLEEV